MPKRKTFWIILSINITVINLISSSRYPTQLSAGIHMTEGTTYYMQGLYREMTGFNHMEVAMKKPGTDDRWEVVTSKYLKKYP